MFLARQHYQIMLPNVTRACLTWTVCHFCGDERIDEMLLGKKDVVKSRVTHQGAGRTTPALTLHTDTLRAEGDTKSRQVKARTRLSHPARGTWVRAASPQRAPRYRRRSRQSR